MDHLNQSNSAKEFTTASTRELWHQSESLFTGAPETFRCPTVAPLTTAGYSPVTYNKLNWVYLKHSPEKQDLPKLSKYWGEKLLWGTCVVGLAVATSSRFWTGNICGHAFAVIIPTVTNEVLPNPQNHFFLINEKALNYIKTIFMFHT